MLGVIILKLSNEILVNSVGVLSKLTNLELPIKLSYAFSKNITKIDAELKAYNIEREKLLNKYGEKDEEGKLKLSEKGEVNILDRENFNKEIAELLQCESEIDIHLLDLEKIDTEIKITPGELMIIDYMFK